MLDHPAISPVPLPSLRLLNGRRLHRLVKPMTCKRMKQISYWKQRETKNSTPEIEVMTNAVWATPIHRREQVKCFGEMSEHDYHETSCAE